MVKPVIIKRVDKGTPLTYSELDTNFQNLDDATINFTGDLGNTRSMDLNDTTSITGNPNHNVKVTVDEATQSIVIDNTLGNHTLEPMGIENRTDSTISFNNSTRQFTIAPTSSSYRIYVAGKEFVKTTSLSVTIPNTTGLYYIYFDTTGTLGYQTDYFYWQSEAPVAYVYWNASAGTNYYFADERHGIALDWATHEYLHRTRGAAYANGFVISNYTTLGSGSVDADAQFDLSGGTFFDEDLKIQITHSATPSANYEQDLQGPARVPVFYRSGAGGLWIKDSATDFPVKQGTSFPTYNLNSGGTWTTPDTGNNKYWVMWIVATHSVTEPVVALMGQREDVNIGTAGDENTWEALDLDGFPSQEFRPLYRLLFQSGGSNTPHCSLKAVLDYRQGEIREAAAVGTTTGLGEVVEDTSPQLGGNLDVNGFKIVSVSNGNITIEPNGVGDIYLKKDIFLGTGVISHETLGGDITITTNDVIGGTTQVKLDASSNRVELDAANVRVGSLNSGASITTNGTGNLALSSNSSAITIEDSVTGHITVAPGGTGQVKLESTTVSVSSGTASAVITTPGVGGITVRPNSNTGASLVVQGSSTAGNLTLTPSGTGVINLAGPVNINSTAGSPTTYENGYYEDMLQTPVAWLKVQISGVDYYLPLYQ